jgi:hydrogenase/urease accessory protein HupE
MNGNHPRNPRTWLVGIPARSAVTCVAGFVIYWLSAAASLAHEVRPAYLELRENQSGEFSVLFKTPMRGDFRLALTPEFGGRTEALTPIVTHLTGDAAVQTWRLRALDPLHGQMVGIAGLSGTMTDALVRIEFADGAAWSQRLTPGQPAASIPQRQSGWAVAGVYFNLGVEHILTGADHLLFVLALLIIVRGTWPLVKTVTAFTVAHSITLALATLGFVHVPSKPVEAVIALSIAFVAAEIVYAYRGQQGLAQRAPWMVAFAFGLLHGLGFAGALSEVGLPPDHVPVALLFFNIGVEAGQLLFVAAMLAIVWVLRSQLTALPRWTRLLPPYAIGSVAMIWVFQRVAVF